MNNIVTYAQTMFDTFDHTPMNEVDSLILSWFSYLHLPYGDDWESISLMDLYKAEFFDEMFLNVYEPESSKQLFAALVASPRFRNIRICGYVQHSDPEIEKQFAAVTIHLDSNHSYISFRGTDSTLLGWKEDFNMAFTYPVPAQREAAAYLMVAARHCCGKLYLGGHSKGGNLAVFAAATSEGSVKGRIEAVYSHDGPGFLESVLESEKYKSIEHLVHKTLPQSSTVGMLMEHQENFKIIKSSRFSFWQHDPFSWIIENQDFVHMDALKPDARYVDRTINTWMMSHTREERELFIDTLFGLIETTDAQTFYDLRVDWQKNFLTMLKAAKEVDPETKKFLVQTVKGLIALSFKNFPVVLKKEASAS